MKILVCVKYVPDAQAERRFAEDGTVDRAGVDGLLCELDEYAVEEALRLAEARPGSSVTVLSMGPDDAVVALRRGLQLGADDAVHVSDPALHGSDALATSLVLAAAVARTGADLVLTGMASTDGGMAVVPALLADRLGVPYLGYAGLVQVLDGEEAGAAATLRIERDAEGGTEVLEARLPAVVSVTDRINDPRYPSFKGIMAAKKKPVTTLTLADLGVAPDSVGVAGAGSAVDAVTPRPPRQAGQVITDSGDGGRQLVDFLAASRLL